MKPRLMHVPASRTTNTPHPRRRATPTPRREAETRAQECAVAATSHLDRVPPSVDDYWGDLRRGQRRIYGGLLAFIDRARTIGTPFEIVRFGIATVYAYACDIYGIDPTTPLSAQQHAA
jgi:hypothetical protein